nr:hypothetical protein [Tanacetum cinerariifolium]
MDDLAQSAGDLGTDFLPGELAQGGPRTEKLACEIDVDDGVPVFQGHLGDGRIFLQTGIGNEDVEPAKGLEGFGEQRFDLVLLRY